MSSSLMATSPVSLLRVASCVASCLALAAPSAAQNALPGPCTPVPVDSAVAIINATLIDGTGAPPRERMTVMVEGERIAAIFPTGSRTVPSAVRTLDLRGDFLIPGLIDTHVHLATDPSGDDERSVTERRLCSALLGGVTTVRDMAGDVRALGSLARDASIGSIASPDIIHVALFAGPAFFADPRTRSSTAGAVPGTLPWMRAITDTTDLRQAVAEARGTGAGAIKIYAALDADLVGRIVAEAHRQNLPVWAHLRVGPAGPADVVNAGTDVVSHALLMASVLAPDLVRTLQSQSVGSPVELDDPALDRLLAEMLRQGTIFDPTLFIYGARQRALEVAAALVAKANRAGVPITAGTDSMGVPDPDVPPNIHAEMRLLVDAAGLTPSQALRAATATAAAATNVLDTRGTIEVGKLADLAVLTANPLQDIANTTRVRLVVKRGRVYERR